jgi:hypothetical protein
LADTDEFTKLGLAASQHRFVSDNQKAETIHPTDSVAGFGMFFGMPEPESFPIRISMPLPSTLYYGCSRRESRRWPNHRGRFASSFGGARQSEWLSSGEDP